MQELRLRQLLGIAARRPALPLGLALALGVGGAAAGLAQPEVYLSTSILRVEDRLDRDMTWAPIEAPRSPAAVLAHTFLESEAFVAAATPEGSDPDALAAGFTVGEKDAGYGLLELRLRGSDPTRLRTDLEALTLAAADAARDAVAQTETLAAMRTVETAARQRFEASLAALADDPEFSIELLLALARGQDRLAGMLLAGPRDLDGAAAIEADRERVLRLAARIAEVDIFRAAWRAAANRAVRAEADARANVDAVRVVRAAGEPRRDAGVGVTVSAAVGAMTGLLLGLGLALLVEPLRGGRD